MTNHLVTVCRNIGVAGGVSSHDGSIHFPLEDWSCSAIEGTGRESDGGTLADWVGGCGNGDAGRITWTDDHGDVVGGGGIAGAAGSIGS